MTKRFKALEEWQKLPVAQPEVWDEFIGTVTFEGKEAEAIRKWFAAQGAKGGRSSSKAKAQAARRNGKKGGRPRKTA